MISKNVYKVNNTQTYREESGGKNEIKKQQIKQSSTAEPNRVLFAM